MRGIEPRTPFLPRKCSTTELHRQACLRKQEWAGWESNPQGQHGQRFYRPSPLPTGLPALQEPAKGFGPRLYFSPLPRSQRRDLNPQPTVYKTVALPLSYAGISFSCNSDNKSFIMLSSFFNL